MVYGIAVALPIPVQSVSSISKEICPHKRTLLPVMPAGGVSGVVKSSNPPAGTSGIATVGALASVKSSV